MITENKSYTVRCDNIGCPTAPIVEPGGVSLSFIIDSLNHMGWFIGLDGSPCYCRGCYAVMQAQGRQGPRQ